MLIIRPKQMEAFQPVADSAFVRRIVAHLRDEHGDTLVQFVTASSPVNQIVDETLQEMVRNGITRAREYEMASESSLASFVVLMFVVAPNFDAHPLIKRVLTDESVPADERIGHLWERTSDQNWEAARQNYDPTDWNLGGPHA